MKSSREAFAKADRVRREARKMQGSGAVIMFEPVIENPDAVLADASDNTVKASVLNDPNAELAIIIPAWQNLPDPSHGQDDLRVFHKVGNFREEIYAGTFDQSNAGDLPLRLVLKKGTEEYGADGTHSFFYEIASFYDQTIYPSDPVAMIFDRMPPNNDNVPDAVPGVAEVIDSNVASVSVLLPDYLDRAGKDKVYYYWLDSVPDNVGGVTPAGEAEVTEADQKLIVPEILIKNGGDGEWFVVYVLVDKAGNISRLSKPRSVTVALGTMPANLQAPLVPLADDGLVDRLDAVQGVKVHVLEYENWKQTDEVSVSWAGSLVGRRQIGEGETFPLVFSVSLDVLRHEYGDPPVGTKAMPVSYTVFRGGQPRGNKDIAVNANFETFGPVAPEPDPDPEWPDPVNPRLPLCDVFGQGSLEANKLLPEHDQQDATLKVKLYEHLEKDDLMEFFWGGTHIEQADYSVKESDTEGDLIERPIPWSYIHSTGNGDVAVHYQLTRAAVPNQPTSADRQVAVSAIVIHPDQPQFEGVNGAGYLSCQSLIDPDNPTLPWAVRVKVDDLSQYGLKENDTVTMHWKLLHADTGNDEVLSWDEEITLGATHPVSGFTWRVEPYDDYILPLYNHNPPDRTGRAYCWYTFQAPARRNQGPDALIVSDIAEQKIAMVSPGGPCMVFFKR